MTKNSTKNMAGSCLCGDVRIKATGVETQHHACHCGICRRWTGGPLFAAQVATFEIENAKPVRRYASSEWAERGFCERCGSNLFYHLVAADKYFVPVGVFDDADAFQLSVELCTDQQKGQYKFDGDLHRLTEQQVFELGQESD